MLPRLLIHRLQRKGIPTESLVHFFLENWFHGGDGGVETILNSIRSGPYF